MGWLHGTSLIAVGLGWLGYYNTINFLCHVRGRGDTKGGGVCSHGCFGVLTVCVCGDWVLWWGLARSTWG
jgi:hypothetical protein